MNNDNKIAFRYTNLQIEPIIAQSYQVDLPFTTYLPTKYAFTLAEVLITLGIIGVVAALTLPSLLYKQQIKELESHFNVAYSSIYQAIQKMSIEDSGLRQTYCAKSSPEESANRDKDYNFITDFSRQFSGSKLYAVDTFNLKTLGYKTIGYYQSSNINYIFNQDGHDNGAFIAKNGMLIASSGCWFFGGLDFLVDTNGKKGPNKFGYDVFYFQVSTKGNILLPSNSNYAPTNSQIEHVNCCAFTGDGNSCYDGMNDNGVACSYFALKDRFPGDESKSYWKNLPKP